MATHAYEPDTIVIEVIESPPRRSSRRLSEGLDVHVQVDGVWHKRTPDHSMTACGDHKLHSEFNRLRHPRLIEKLCTTCFTPFERGIADAANAAELKKVT